MSLKKFFTIVTISAVALGSAVGILPYNHKLKTSTGSAEKKVFHPVLQKSTKMEKVLVQDIEFMIMLNCKPK